MSSPGTYPRCSAKSTEAPKYGARCSPLMKPSTTVFATSSRLPIRARTAGSTKRAPGMAAWLRSMSHPGARSGDGLEQPVDERVGRDSLRLRVEVGEDAVAQHRVRQRPDILEAHVVASAHE